jgi:tetratricopeptide (TPR) repeat protein
MKTTRSTLSVILAAFLAVCLIPAAGFAEDTNVIIKHSVEGTADEVNAMKDFDFELQQRERDRMKQWDIEDSNEAVSVGDTYYSSGEMDDAISFYQIAIKIDPANKTAHEKYIAARKAQQSQVSSHYYQAMEYYRKGMKQKAIDELVTELRQNPDNEAARIKLNEIEASK